MKASLDYEDYDCDEVYTIYYDEEKNVMIDCDGFMLFDIFDLITPNDLFLFKSKKEDMLIRGKRHLVELIWPDFDA